MDLSKIFMTCPLLAAATVHLHSPQGGIAETSQVKIDKMFAVNDRRTARGSLGRTGGEADVKLRRQNRQHALNRIMPRTEEDSCVDIS